LNIYILHCHILILWIVWFVRFGIFQFLRNKAWVFLRNLRNSDLPKFKHFFLFFLQLYSSFGILWSPSYLFKIIFLCYIIFLFFLLSGSTITENSLLLLQLENWCHLNWFSIIMLFYLHVFCYHRIRNWKYWWKFQYQWRLVTCN
jgi:hypothetical protein